MTTRREAAPPTITPITPRAVVEHCFGAGGIAELATVYAVAEVLGIEDQPVRLAIRRLIAAGVIEQHGRGRAGSLRLAGQARLRAALDLEYWVFALQHDDGLTSWNGRWHLIAFSIPEHRRTDRDALRSTLAYLGAAALTPGLYVSPHDLTAALEAELTGRNVTNDLTTAITADVVHGGRNLADAVPELWPLDTIRAGYDGLEREISAWRSRLTATDGATATTRLAARIALHAALDIAVAPDPLLPSALLPVDWPGPRVRTIFRAIWAELDGELSLSVLQR